MAADYTSLQGLLFDLPFKYEYSKMQCNQIQLFLNNSRMNNHTYNIIYNNFEKGF